jgi:o-succinylbenzoate synthase
VKVRQVTVVPYALRLRRPLRTAAGAFARRHGWLVRVSTAAGARGHGDVAPWPGFGATGAGEVEAALGSLADRFADVSVDTPGALPEHLTGLPAEVAHGIELACLDALAQEAGISVARLLAADATEAVPVHALVADAYSGQMAVRDGVRALKMKLGVESLGEEVTRVGALRAAVGDDVALRLDANGAWPAEVALRAARLLAAFRPEWLEQPIAAAAPDALESLAWLRREGGVPIAVDESVSTGAGLDAVLAADAADVVVLKPMFAGGLLATLAMAARCRAAGVRPVVTHALESAVGRAGALHVSAALRLDTPCGLADPLAEDVAAGLSVAGGVCRVPEGPGLGLVFPEAARC